MKRRTFFQKEKRLSYLLEQDDLLPEDEDLLLGASMYSEARDVLLEKKLPRLGKEKNIILERWMTCSKKTNTIAFFEDLLLLLEEVVLLLLEMNSKLCKLYMFLQQASLGPHSCAFF